VVEEEKHCLVVHFSQGRERITGSSRDLPNTGSRNFKSSSFLELSLPQESSFASVNPLNQMSLERRPAFCPSQVCTCHRRSLPTCCSIAGVPGTAVRRHFVFWDVLHERLHTLGSGLAVLLWVLRIYERDLDRHTVLAYRPVMASDQRCLCLLEASKSEIKKSLR
jgi:hypothetical protein